jgi:hypothetical protein
MAFHPPIYLDSGNNLQILQSIVTGWQSAAHRRVRTPDFKLLPPTTRRTGVSE